MIHYLIDPFAADTRNILSEMPRGLVMFNIEIRACRTLQHEGHGGF